MPTFWMMSSLDAPSARMTSSTSGSIVASPVATFTTMGKNEIRNAVSTAGTQPTPNQITRIGTTATFGMALKPTSIGCVPACTSLDAPSATPRKRPNTTASANPAMVIQSVWPEWTSNGVRNCQSATAIDDGVGSTKLETLKSLTRISQTTKKPRVKTHGARFSARRLGAASGFMGAPSGSRSGVGDVPAQLVHDVGEFAGIGHFQVPRARQVDDPL